MEVEVSEVGESPHFSRFLLRTLDEITGPLPFQENLGGRGTTNCLERRRTGLFCTPQQRILVRQARRSTLQTKVGLPRDLLSQAKTAAVVNVLDVAG